MYNNCPLPVVQGHTPNQETFFGLVKTRFSAWGAKESYSHVERI